MKHKARQLRRLVLMTQLCVSVASPLFLCIWGSLWLQRRFQLGRWVMAAGVLLGVGGAVAGLCSTLRELLRDEEKKEPPPPAFDRHE